MLQGIPILLFMIRWYYLIFALDLVVRELISKAADWTRFPFLNEQRIKYKRLIEWMNTYWYIYIPLRYLLARKLQVYIYMLLDDLSNAEVALVQYILRWIGSRDLVPVRQPSYICNVPMLVPLSPQDLRVRGGKGREEKRGRGMKRE